MVDEGRPPVTEVVLSVAFDPQSSLSGPQLFVTLRDLMSRYSKIEEQPPYDMPLELPTDRQLAQAPEPPFQIIGSGLMERRYWLLDPMDDSTVIQIQSGYFAVNWRKTKNASSYIGFESLARHFQEILQQVQDAIAARGGAALSVRQAELSYINIIQPDSLWGDHAEISKVLSLNSPMLQDFEQLNVAYTRPLTDDAAEFVGRLRSFIQTGFVASQEDTAISQAITSGLTPIINVTTQVRSSRLERPSPDLMLGFLRYAHEQAGKAFQAITTADARAHWGI